MILPPEGSVPVEGKDATLDSVDKHLPVSALQQGCDVPAVGMQKETMSFASNH